MRASSILLSLVSVAVAAGCAAGSSAYHANAPQKITTELSDQRLLLAIVEVAHANAWTIHDANVKYGRFELHEPAVIDTRMATRRRWIVRVSNGTVGVQMFLDFDDEGTWKSYPVVCGDYDYAQELALLDSIERAARSIVAAVPTPAPADNVTNGRDR